MTGAETSSKRIEALQARIRLLATASIGIAFLVMGIKFLAWWLTGSVALYSDALESIVNVIAAMAAWYAIRIAHRPPDDTHPFGHHKAEYFSAVLEGVLIAVAALLILHEAFNALTGSRDLAITEPAAGLAVNLVAAAINGGWAWLLMSTGRKAHSPALQADAHHIFSDVITSAGVMIGLLLALLTGWLILDPVLAIIVAFNILWQGWKVINESVQGLMDHALEADEQEAIRQVITENAVGAIEFHDLKTRRAGPARFVEFHLVVPSAMSVADAHAICDRIEEGVRRKCGGAKTTIHVEPEHKAKHEGFLAG